MSSQAEFKDVRVSSGSQVLYSSDFANGASEWRTFGRSWTAADGVYKQTSSDVRARALTGSDDWRDYSVTLKVRKTAGDGRASVSVRGPGPGRGVALNLGGSAGTLASLDRMAMGGQNSLASVPGAMETGRWYDVRIDVTGPRAQVFIDGKPALDVANFYQEMVLSPLEAAAPLAESSGEIVIKVVNFNEQPQTNDIRLEGAPKIEPEGTEIVLSSASLADENTIEQPRKVVPVTSRTSGFAPEFTRTFAPRSLTILRLKTAKTVASARP